ncbi:MAG: patatin-like phospholipase family protein [Myxococcales bacterium]|jgi:hypothetical protein|nr:MAG: patatin-like phospholipase family protein [Myxococcales bacterium]
MPRSLTIRAGRAARATIAEHGFDRELFSTMVGASGGPKWLVLSRLDRLLHERVLSGRKSPIDLIGSSIGSFRHACHAQRDAPAALDRFEDAYIEQAYGREPTPAEVTAESRRILAMMLGDTGRREIVENAVLRSNIVAVRSRAGVRADRRLPLALGLGVAAAANAVSRRALGLFFERAVFGPARSTVSFNGFTTHSVPLTVDNLADALTASGSIPLVMAGVHDVAGAPAGVYRDGGIIDYHFDFRFRARDGLVLYPHFFDRITPGWFDKGLRRRRPAPQDLDRVVMISPANAFIARLPGGRVPDRGDFRDYSTAERIRIWRGVVDGCREMADELGDLIDGGHIADCMEVFE